MFPDRVVINKEGEAVPPSPKHTGICWTDIFIRKDGWSLGWKDGLEEVAYSLWSDEWFAFYETETNKVLPIEEYLKRKQKESE